MSLFHTLANCYMLPGTHYMLSVTHYMLSVTHYHLPVTHYRINVTYVLLPVTRYQLHVTHSLTSVTHYQSPALSIKKHVIKAINLSTEKNEVSQGEWKKKSFNRPINNTCICLQLLFLSAN